MPSWTSSPPCSGIRNPVAASGTKEFFLTLRRMEEVFASHWRFLLHSGPRCRVLHLGLTCRVLYSGLRCPVLTFRSEVTLSARCPRRRRTAFAPTGSSPKLAGSPEVPPHETCGRRSPSSSRTVSSISFHRSNRSLYPNRSTRCPVRMSRFVRILSSTGSCHSSPSSSMTSQLSMTRSTRSAPAGRSGTHAPPIASSSFSACGLGLRSQPAFRFCGLQARVSIALAVTPSIRPRICIGAILSLSARVARMIVPAG